MGGAERCLLEICQCLRSAQPAWKLALLVPRVGKLSQAAEDLGVAITVLPFPWLVEQLGDSALNSPDETNWLSVLLRGSLAAPGVARYVRKLRRMIWDFAPNVVHANGFKMEILSAWTSPKGVPLVWHTHDYLSNRRVMRRLFQLHARRCDAMIVNSNSVAEDVRLVCGDSIKLIPLHNMIDLSRYAPTGLCADLDRLSGLTPAPDGTVRVGLLATMARWKGHQVFLRALAALPSGLPIRGYVIGGPIYETSGSQRSLSELRELARSLGIEDRVGFTGFVDDPAAAIRALDIVAHASTLREPFGRVVLEAMACGRAVIASAHGGVLEIMTPGTDGLAVSPGDHDELARAIAKLALDMDWRRRLGSAGRITAQQRFGINRMADTLIPLYQKVANDHAEVRARMD
jgi:glycosyltransferase involved in cell wall biosynthesis